MTFLAIDSADISSATVSSLEKLGIDYQLSGQLAAKRKHAFSFRDSYEMHVDSDDFEQFEHWTDEGNHACRKVVPVWIGIARGGYWVCRDCDKKLPDTR